MAVDFNEHLGGISCEAEIFTDAGNKKIIDIVRNKLPVKVLSFDENTGCYEFKNIVSYSKHTLEQEMVELTFDSGTKLRIAVDERVLLKSGEWKCVSALAAGDDLIDLADYPAKYTCLCGYKTDAAPAYQGHRARCKKYLDSRPQLSSEEIQTVLARYREGESINHLVIEYGCSREYFERLFVKNNIHIRTLQEVTSLPVVVKRREQFNLANYGVKNTFQLDTTKETLKNKYGVENIFQTDFVIEKSKQTKFERYHSIVGKAPENRISETERVFEQFLIDENISYIPQYRIPMRDVNDKAYMVDFYLPCKHMLIEIYGDYWHANPLKYSANTWIYGKSLDGHGGKALSADIWKHDAARQEYLENRGFKFKAIWESAINDSTFRKEFFNFYDNN